MPPISPAPRSRKQTSSPASRNPTSSPETARRRLRPYVDPSYMDEVMQTDESAASSSSRRPSQDKGGLRSLSGKRRLDASGGTSRDTGVTTALSSSRTPSYAHTRNTSQTHNHVKFAFPPSTSARDLAALANSRSPASTSRTGKSNEMEPEQVGSMLIGVVGKVWQEAKEKEKTHKTRKRIADLENEVVRLKTEVSYCSDIVCNHTRSLTDITSLAVIESSSRSSFFARASIPCSQVSPTVSPSSTSASTATSSCRPPSSPFFRSSRSLHGSSFSPSDSSSSFAEAEILGDRRGTRHGCVSRRARREEGQIEESWVADERTLGKER